MQHDACKRIRAEQAFDMDFVPSLRIKRFTLDHAC